MIQRKQSLFLLLAVIAYALCLFLPIAGVTPAGMGAEGLVYNLGMVDGDKELQFLEICLPLFLLLALSTVISLATIFLYKNRKLQINLCSIASLFTGLWCVDYALMLFGVVPLTDNGEMNVKFAACLPIVSLILVLMARKGVQDDEKLIKATDRIR